jgi:hypothetical protein
VICPTTTRRSRHRFQSPGVARELGPATGRQRGSQPPAARRAPGSPPAGLARSVADLRHFRRRLPEQTKGQWLRRPGMGQLLRAPLLVPDGRRAGSARRREAARHQNKAQGKRASQDHGVTPQRQRAHVDPHLRSWLPTPLISSWHRRSLCCPLAERLQENRLWMAMVCRGRRSAACHILPRTAESKPLCLFSQEGDVLPGGYLRLVGYRKIEWSLIRLASLRLRLQGLRCQHVNLFVSTQ